MIRRILTKTPPSTARQSYSRWLALFAATLLGMFCASSVDGGDVLFDTISAQPNPAEKSLIDSYVITPATHPETECCLQHEPSDQLVRTRETRLRKRCVTIKSKDQVWFVSARQSHLCPSDFSKVQCSQLLNSQWNLRNISDLTAAHSNEKNYVTFVYVHGNRTNESWASSRGLQVYETLFASHLDRPPVRFVIYAWKSEQEKLRLLRDYKQKSARAPIVGQNFGLFLDKFSDRNMVVCGFSLGSQVVLTGLSRCHQNQFQIPADSRYKVALLAPAMDPGYVCPCLTQLIDNRLIQRTEVFYSQSDLAIRAAERIARKSCRTWIPVFQRLSKATNPINPVYVFDLTSSVEKRHSAYTYVESDSVQKSLRQMVCEVSIKNNAMRGHVAPQTISVLEPTLLDPVPMHPMPERVQLRSPILELEPKAVELVPEN